LPRAKNSLRTSFWTVPRSLAGTAPWCRARTTYIAKSVGAVAFIVIDVETSASGMPSKRVARSPAVDIATPVRPTSPRASGASES
jgi:hypothetical protein